MDFMVSPDVKIQNEIERTAAPSDIAR